MVLILTKGIVDFFPEMIERDPVMANCSEKREMIGSVVLWKYGHHVTINQSVSNVKLLEREQGSNDGGPY